MILAIMAMILLPLVMALLLLAPLVLKLMNRSEESLLIVEDDRDQKQKAGKL